MAGRDPPKNHVEVSESREPFATATQNDEVLTVGIRKGAQRFEGFPHRHVHDQALVPKCFDSSRIASVGLQPPNKAGRSIRGRVDRVERSHEIGEKRSIERLTRQCDVHLGEMKGHAR